MGLVETEMNWPATASLFCRLGLLIGSAVLLHTASIKMLDPARFMGIISSHDVVPVESILAVGWAIIGIELVIGLMLLLRLAERRPVAAPALIMATLFAAMSVYAAMVWRNPPPQPVGCGCGLPLMPDVTDSGDWAFVALRNAALTITAAAFGLIADWRSGPLTMRSEGDTIRDGDGFRVALQRRQRLSPR